MDLEHAPVAAAEAILRAASSQLTTPRPGECLLCFVRRQLEAFGCDTSLRFARHYRDVMVPRATALERRLGQKGGYCDCEIFLNGYAVVGELWTPEREIERDGYVEIVDREPPADLPDCRGVRRSSTQPCGLWERIRPGWF